MRYLTHKILYLFYSNCTSRFTEAILSHFIQKSMFRCFIKGKDEKYEYVEKRQTKSFDLF